MNSIYLGGPIGGLSTEEARAWRFRVRKEFAWHGIKCYDPCDDDSELHPKRHIVNRDKFFIKKSDLILMNMTFYHPQEDPLVQAAIPCIGSLCEIGMAYAYDKPVVLILPVVKKYRDMLNHSFINEICVWQCENLEDGIKYVKQILK